MASGIGFAVMVGVMAGGIMRVVIGVVGMDMMAAKSIPAIGREI